MIKAADQGNNLPDTLRAEPATNGVRKDCELSTRLDLGCAVNPTAAACHTPRSSPGPGDWPRGPVMVRVCSWCQSVMGWKQEPGLKRTEFTHGICERCTCGPPAGHDNLLDCVERGYWYCWDCQKVVEIKQRAEDFISCAKCHQDRVEFFPPVVPRRTAA